MSEAKLFRLGFLPIPLFVILIALLHFEVNPVLFYEPAWLLPITNTIFVTAVCFVVAYIALRNYRYAGQIEVLLLGCGVLAFGIGAAVAGFTRNIPETGANINVTIYNLGALIGSLFHFISALLIAAGLPSFIGARHRTLWVTLGYAGVAVLMTSLSIAGMNGWISPFFIQQVGPTQLRQAVLGTAAILFGYSFIVFMTSYFRKLDSFLYWYSCALGLTAISLAAFLVESAVGSLVGWAGRISQYIGGGYFLIAMASAARNAQAGQRSIDSLMTASFGSAEEKFRALAENAPDIIRRFDRDFRHIYVNAAGCRFYGKPARAIIGKTMEEAGLPPDYCSLWRERIENVFDSSRQMQAEEFHPTGNGKLFYQSQCVPEFAPDGSVANVLVVSRDLTDYKNVEEELRRERDIIAGVLDTAGALVMVLDRDGRIVRFNRACEMTTGYSAAEMMGLASWKFLVPADELAEVDKTLQALHEGNLPCPHENHWVARDGTRRLIEWSNTVIANAQGGVEYVIGTGIDITERRQMEEAINKSFLELEERVKQRTAELLYLNEQLREEIQQRFRTEQSLRLEESRLDALLRLSQMSDATTGEIAGFILEQGIALTQSKVGFVGFLSEDETDYTLHAVSKDVVKECNVAGDPMQWRVSESGIWADAIRERRTLFVNDYTQPRLSKKGFPPGHVPIERFMAVPCFDGNRIVAIAGLANKAADYDKSDERQMILLLGGVWNFMQRQRAKEALQEAYSDLERRVEQRTAELAAAKAAAEAASTAKSRFLANISHELRTPMNAILSMIDLALAKQTNPAASDCLKTAKESADLLLALLNDLLDSAKIEAGKLEIESVPFSLRRTLDQAVSVLAVRSREKGISFFCRISPEAPDALVGDPMRLRQVLLNLGGNAIKFTERGGVMVAVELDSQDAGFACLKFSVRDSGIGIRPEELARIFRPFTQADPSTTRRFGGTGLGLSIASNLVGLMGGRIWAESEPDKGSNFHFMIRLPLAKEAPAEAAAHVASPTPEMRLKVLLAEDNLANQKLAACILQERGHAVDIADDGRQAVRMAGNNSYDVILMDIQMPGMSGLEATAAIRAGESGGKRIPIIAMTAYAMKSDRAQCLAAGMDGYISKPINMQEMISLVERLGGNPSFSAKPAALEGPPGDLAAAPSPRLFDPQAALKLCFDKPHILKKMIGYFMNELDVVLPQMRAVLEKGDLVELGNLGHRLKGTLVYLGADPAREAALRVERFALHANSQDDAAEALKALEYQCRRLKEVLEKPELIQTARPLADQSAP